MDGAERRKIYTFKDQAGKEVSVPIYEVIFTQAEDDVTGRLVINLKKGKKLEHQGIKIELIGRIGNFYSRYQLRAHTDLGLRELISRPRARRSYFREHCHSLRL